MNGPIHPSQSVYHCRLSAFCAITTVYCWRTATSNRWNFRSRLLPRHHPCNKCRYPLRIMLPGRSFQSIKNVRMPWDRESPSPTGHSPVTRQSKPASPQADPKARVRPSRPRPAATPDRPCCAFPPLRPYPECTASPRFTTRSHNRSRNSFTSCLTAFIWDRRPWPPESKDINCECLMASWACSA